MPSTFDKGTRAKTIRLVQEHVGGFWSIGRCLCTRPHQVFRSSRSEAGCGVARGGRVAVSLRGG